MLDDKFFREMGKHEKRVFKFVGAFAIIMLMFYAVVIAGLITLAVVLLQHYKII